MVPWPVFIIVILALTWEWVWIPKHTQLFHVLKNQYNILNFACDEEKFAVHFENRWGHHWVWLSPYASLHTTSWLCILDQTSGVTGGGGGGGRGAECPPRDFWPGNFCWRTGKKQARKKGKRGENWEEKVENLKLKQQNVIKRGEDLFFFFFFFCFSLLKNDKNLFWVYQNGNFLPGKSISRREKNIRKKNFAPSEKYACYAPGPNPK